MRHIPKDADIREEYEGEIVNFVIAKITPPTASSPRLVLQTTDGKEISFHGVTPALYQFQIGSYAPVDKWLKYRKKDAVLLGLDDLIHIKNMLLVLKRTMSIMQEIEALGGAWIKDI